MNKELDDLLKYDSLAEAEKVTGKYSGASESTVLLGMALGYDKNKKLEAMLQSSDDTGFSETKMDYLAKLSRFGFEQIYEESFKEGGRDETLNAMFHFQYSILLIFDTYNGNVNSGKFYYHWKPKGESFPYHITSSGGYVDMDNKIWSGNHDCREAVKHNINNLLEYGEFVAWVQQPFIWFLHYGDTKTKDYDYKGLTRSRLAKLPEKVRQAILA
jgi:hypothetical protein